MALVPGVIQWCATEHVARIHGRAVRQEDLCNLEPVAPCRPVEWRLLGLAACIHVSDVRQEHPAWGNKPEVANLLDLRPLVPIYIFVIHITSSLDRHENPA